MTACASEKVRLAVGLLGLGPAAVAPQYLVDPTLIGAEHRCDDMFRLASLKQQKHGFAFGTGTRLGFADRDDIEFNPGDGVPECSHGLTSLWLCAVRAPELAIRSEREPHLGPRCGFARRAGGSNRPSGNHMLRPHVELIQQLLRNAGCTRMRNVSFMQFPDCQIASLPGLLVWRAHLARRGASAPAASFPICGRARRRVSLGYRRGGPLPLWPLILPVLDCGQGSGCGMRCGLAPARAFFRGVPDEYSRRHSGRGPAGRDRRPGGHAWPPRGYIRGAGGAVVRLSGRAGHARRYGADAGAAEGGAGELAAGGR